MINKSSFGNKYPIKKLGEIVSFLDSQRKPIKESERIFGQYPYYGANGQQGWINDYIFDEELILLAEDGGHFYNPNRGVAYKISGKTWVNNHAHVLKPLEGLDINYLCRILENYDLTPWITGTTRPKLTKTGAYEIQIPLPPLPTQTHIAHLLDKADELRQKRQTAIKKLDDLLQATFIKMFGDPVMNDKGWETVKLGTLVTIKGGGTPSRDNPDFWNGDISWVTVKDFKDNFRISKSEETITSLGVEKSSTNIIPANTIILPTRMGLGKFAITDKEVAINQDVKALFIHNQNQINILYLIWLLIQKKQEIISLGKGATVKGITLDNLTKIQIMIPPIELQTQFAHITTHIETQKAKLQAQADELERLFLSLQQRAFNGELTHD